MRQRMLKKGLLGWVLVLAVVCIASGPSFAVDYYLVAGPVTPSPVMPDGTSVAMWGFDIDPSCPGAGVPACFTDGPDTVPTSPGPRLTVPEGEELHIYLYNGLPTTEGVSIIIPGYEMPTLTGPTWDDGSVGPRPGMTARVRSFGREAAPGGMMAYHWDTANMPRDGSFIYQSGTHPQVQVQMGLYGAITRDFDDGGPEAYDSGLIANAAATYDTERILFYSEIDPALHGAVAGGTYGTTGPTSTIDYRPAFYRFTDAAGATMVYTSAGQPSIDLTACTNGTELLLRFFNAGLQTHVPTPGFHVDLIAEDGNPYPYPRYQYSVLLPAGKTQDAHYVCDGTEGVVNILDRSTYASRMTPAPPVNRSPVAVNDTASTALGVPVLIDVLANDYDLDFDPISISVFDVSSAQGGSVACVAAGCTYTPAGGPYNDTFMYTITDGFTTASATVTIDVAVVNDMPVAANQAITLDLTTPVPDTLPLDITLGGADSDPLTFQVGSGPLNGMLAPHPTTPDVPFPGAHWEYTPDAGFKGVDTFTFTAHDGSATSNVATVTITVLRDNIPPVAVDDFFSTSDNLGALFNVLANDSDPDGDPLSFGGVVAGPTCGTGLSCDVSGGCVFTPPAFPSAPCTFTYQATDGMDPSNVATVTITIMDTVTGAIFSDNFNRPSGNDLGNGWMEVENAPTDLQIGPVQK